MYQHKGHGIPVATLSHPLCSFKGRVPYAQIVCPANKFKGFWKVDRRDRGEILVGDWWLSSAGLLTRVYPFCHSLCPCRCPSVPLGHHLWPSGPWCPPPVYSCPPTVPSQRAWGSRQQLLRWKCISSLACLFKAAIMLGVIKQPSSAPR